MWDQWENDSDDGDLPMDLDSIAPTYDAINEDHARAFFLIGKAHADSLTSLDALASMERASQNDIKMNRLVDAMIDEHSVASPGDKLCTDFARVLLEMKSNTSTNEHSTHLAEANDRELSDFELLMSDDAHAREQE